MQATTQNSIFPTPLSILACVPVFFCLTSYFISIITGWTVLARRFRKHSEPHGHILTAGPFFYTVYMRFWCHYGSAIRMTAADDALYLSVIFPLRIGHPPLRIPWSEIEFSRDSFLLARDLFCMTIGRDEPIPIRISDHMARNLGILNRLEKQSPARQ